MSDVKAVIERMISAPMCCAELKAAGRAYLDAAGTPGEESARAALLAEIDEDAVPIEGLIDFISSERGKAIFGDKADDMLKKAQELKASGGKYCFCEACSAAIEARELLKAR